jgi:hypothetical protein
LRGCSSSKNLWIGAVINHLDKERAEFAEHAAENSQLETHRRPPAVKSHKKCRTSQSLYWKINYQLLQPAGVRLVNDTQVEACPNSTSGDVLAAAAVLRE